ncbi:MAG TPA: hypothetical protein VHO67_08475 [Polyangia bacterium]|nr:hypothetical protein [Polyangia bacterium]
MSRIRSGSFGTVGTLSLAVVSLLGTALWGARGHAASATELKLKSVDDFKKCADEMEADPQICLEALERLVKAQPGQAFAAGKAVRTSMNHAAAIPFFDKALQKKADKVHCADPDLRMALVAGLSLPPDNVTAVSARRILFDRCWSEAQAPVLQALAQPGASGYLAENVCPKLAERNVANPVCGKRGNPPAPAAEPKWKDIDARTMQADGPAKVYRGTEGRSVTMAKLRNEDAYLIRFDGFRGAWNGRVVLHRETAAGSGYDYFTDVAGTRWVSVVSRDGSTEVYPHGDRGPFSVGYDETASRGASAQSLIDQFRKQR